MSNSVVFPYLMCCIMSILYIEINTCCVVSIKFYDVFFARYFIVSLFVQGRRDIINAHMKVISARIFSSMVSSEVVWTEN